MTRRHRTCRRPGQGKPLAHRLIPRETLAHRARKPTSQRALDSPRGRPRPQKHHRLRRGWKPKVDGMGQATHLRLDQQLVAAAGQPGQHHRPLGSR